MPQLSKTSATCFMVGVIVLIIGCGKGIATPTNCSSITCPTPMCANPTTPPGECCPSCQGSLCPFKGCLNHRQGKMTWQPDPCTFCQCLDGRTVCAEASCISPSPEDCLGFPVTTKPWECCPSCDYNFPAQSCNVVPRIAGKRNLTVSDGTRACVKQVTLSKCDKSGYRAGGKKFQCMPVMGQRTVKFSDGCPLYTATYIDVVQCKAMLNDDITVGCDTVVP